MNGMWLLLMGALAGGMGWGIRGQYGHETGAMIAGLLVTTVIAVGYLRHLPSLPVARAMALGTIGIGIGGSMTYGQTIGLTQDSVLIGNWEALRWGMLGLAIKGGVWIGLGGMFLGMGLGGRLPGPGGMLAFVLALMALRLLGIWTLNEPFVPNRQLLPAIYFSADWHWRPGEELKPRREVWGGLLLALVLGALWLRIFRSDRLAGRLAIWGFVGGAIGFPLGQTLQAWHAWNADAVDAGILKSIAPHINWWNTMETTFGCVMGAFLTAGVARNRHLVELAVTDTEPALPGSEVTVGRLWSDWLEIACLFLHVTFLIAAEFGSLPWYGDGLLLAAIPLVATSFGRYWPYYLLMPVTVLPIAGKTFRNLVLQESALSAVQGGILLLALPMAVMVGLAVWWSRQDRQSARSDRFTPWLLFVATWTYFLLNFAFFRFPWPWQEWTQRTPHALFYLVAACCLTALSLITMRRDNRSPTTR